MVSRELTKCFSSFCLQVPDLLTLGRKVVDIESLERMNSQPFTHILLCKGPRSFSSSRKKSLPLAHFLFHFILLEGREMLSKLMLSAPATFRVELSGGLWLW